MEPASKDNILDSKAKPNALQDIKKFVNSFHKYLLKTESIQGAVCHFEGKDPNIVSTPEPGSMQSPYHTICKALGSNYPCLHEPIRELCLYIFPMLTKGLKEDQLNLTEDETHDLADALEALMFIAVYVKTATKLYTCENHQDKIMGNLDWPAPLIRKLIPYLVQHMDSTTRIDIVLLRTLEIIVNPPQAFGSSKLWLTIMREIEEDFILEDSQQSKFLSLLFVMLNTEARVRLCGIYQEQLQQLLDAETLPTLSLEILTLIYYMSSNSKTQQALIKNGVHTILIDWMTECFMARKDLSKDNGQDKFDIVMQIFLNLVQGLGKTALDEVVSFIQNRAVAHYIRYEKSDIFEEVMSPILSILPFSSFVPVVLNIGGHLSGNDILNLRDEPTASLFEDRLLSNLDAKQNRDLKDLIARHLKLEPFEKFNIEWAQFNKGRCDFVESMRTADSVLITCMHIPLGRIAKIGFYVGAGFRVDRNGFLVSNTSKENFLFIYLDNGEINLLDIDFEIRMNQTWEPFSFEIKDLATDMLILTCPNENKSNVLICNSLLRRLCKEYGKVAFKGDVQFSRECINLWLGTTSIDLYKNRPRECIYGPNYLASDLRHSLQLLRPNNHTYFVPKDLTLKEFLRPVLPKCEKILDTLLVYHEQHIVTLSTKLVDLKPSTESQSLFQIQDLRIVCLDHPEQLCQAIMTPPVETYKTIMPQYYSKLKTPVLNHLLAEGGSLDILKKIAPGRTLGTDFLTAHQIILEKIGPYAPALGSVMGKDIIMILYQILFIRCEDKKFIPRILQKAILKYIQQAQLQSADPHQLHAFLESAIADVLEKDVVHEKSASRLVEKYNLLLQELKDADLIQDSYLVGLLLSTLFKGEDALGAKGSIITQNLSKPLKYCSQIEELLTEGFDIIIPYCTDQVCNRNFTRLAQSVTAFMNIKGYPLALTLSEFFLETLSDLILQFKKQKKGANFVLYVDSTIEEILLKLIHFDFTTLSKVLQAKQDLASEVDVYEVLDQSLNVFNFLQDELKKIHDRKNIASTQVEMLVETVESASTVLKILAHEQVLLSQGFEAANAFSLQYLAKMESARTAQTLAQVFSLLDSINDDGLFFQTLASILELLEAWSKNEVLVNVFDTKVRDPKNEESMKTVPFFEYYMTFSKKLESANQIAQLIAQNNEIDKEELKANKKAVIVRVFALFKSIQENLNNR